MTVYNRPHLLFFLQSLPWLKDFIILAYFLGANISRDFVICLLYPASSTSPPSSQITLSKHSSDSMMAMYMSWTLSSMLAAGDSSRVALFFLPVPALTGTVVTPGIRRKRAATTRRGMRIMDIPSLPDRALPKGLIESSANPPVALVS